MECCGLTCRLGLRVQCFKVIFGERNTADGILKHPAAKQIIDQRKDIIGHAGPASWPHYKPQTYSASKAAPSGAACRTMPKKSQLYHDARDDFAFTECKRVLSEGFQRNWIPVFVIIDNVNLDTRASAPCKVSVHHVNQFMAAIVAPVTGTCTQRVLERYVAATQFGPTHI